MKSFPIIPIWLMAIICVILLLLVIKNYKKNWSIIVIILLLFIVNLRFMIVREGTISATNNLDVLFVIDTTISMDAMDYNGTNTRLSAVRNDLDYIVKELNGARFSIITFNNAAQIVTPFTNDINMTLQTIKSLQAVQYFSAKGSSLNYPIEPALNMLKSSDKKEDRRRIVFFVSDGEITNESKLESYSGLKDYITDGAVLGYGTSVGGYMYGRSRYSEKKDFIYDYTSTPFGKAVSRIDEDNLKNIANDMDISYIHMEKQSNINSKIKEIHKIIESDYESSDKSSYDDTYQYLFIPIIVLLIIKYIDVKRSLV